MAFVNPKRISLQSLLIWGPSQRPLAWTIYLGILNAFLSYFHTPLAWKLGLGFGGLILPLGVFLWETPLAGSGEILPFLREDGVSKFPVWAFGVVLFVGVGLRIYHPSSFIPWPLFDETVNAYSALKLDQHWTWYPFFSRFQLPPLLIWMIFLGFKVLGSFITVIRFLPIVLSLILLSLAYPVACAFFSRFFSFLFFSLTALSFGTLFFGRFCHQGLLMLVMEYLVFWGLGRFFKSPTRSSALKSFLLGLCAGIGFYTYFSWLLVAFLLSFCLFCFLIRQSQVKSSGIWFILGILPPLIPLVTAALAKGYGYYLGELWSLKTGNDWDGQVQTTSFCLSSFLWGNHSGFFSYGPVWGGFLNPVLGSFFLMGLVELWRFREKLFTQAILGGMVFFIVPAVMTNTLNNIREIQAVPFLLLVSAVGVQKLVGTFSGPGRWLLLIFILSASLTLDFIHLEKFSSYITRNVESQRTFEIQKAYEMLDQIHYREGPGLVLTSFSNDTDTYDQSLLISTYPFNASKNPSLDPLKARWLSIVTNIHFQPFLLKRFSGSQWFRLSAEGSRAGNDYSGGLVLGVIPLDPINREKLTDWIQADSEFSEMSAKVMDMPVIQARRKILELLAEMKPGLSVDPFVRSCYWEMVYFNNNWENLYGDKNLPRNLSAALQALQNAIREGYPTAYFYNELGSLLAIQGDRAGALSAFKKAVLSKPNDTPAAENLRVLENSRE